MDPSKRTLRVDNPFSGEVTCELPYASANEAMRAVDTAAQVQRKFGRTPVGDRAALVRQFCNAARADKESIAQDITQMMGKPLKEARGEVDTMIDRASYMASIAEEALADEPLPEKAGFKRFIAREPLGVVLDVAPWNYPLLTAVNVIVPAVLAGNSVIVKHASRTPLCGEHFARAFAKAGAPKDLVQAVATDHGTVSKMIARPEVGYVAFTGSVPGGHHIYGEAAKRFIGVGLELGGKDPGYVAEDADLGHAVANLIDGAFYNAGQSCCGIERIYVHEKLYDRFVEQAAQLARSYQLGDPMDDATTMGPMATADAPGFLAKQIQEAKAKGARVLTGGEPTSVNGKGRFFAPTVVAEATHQMSMMVEESFGPIVGIAPVKDDQQALQLMNDSPYGLTAAIWTASEERARELGRQLETGTVFMNRCDYLDPALAWVGVKDSGLGCSLSKHGLLALTRPKSFHLRLKTS
jgi:acyl-CoA reductase-like NAD-dependent aldehyde dehydrogenase